MIGCRKSQNVFLDKKKLHKEKGCHNVTALHELYHKLLYLVLPGYTFKASSRHFMAAFKSSMQMQ